MAVEGKFVVVVVVVDVGCAPPTEALRLRCRRWPGADVKSGSGKLRRAPAEVENVDEVRGGIAAGDCRKAWAWLRTGTGPVAGAALDVELVEDEGWAAMVGWFF
jgi:hypothetical protein